MLSGELLRYVYFGVFGTHWASGATSGQVVDSTCECSGVSTTDLCTDLLPVEWKCTIKIIN